MNIVNPTVEEIWEWAWNEKSMAPTEDWDLIIADLYPDEYIRIASMAHCPGREFFLKLLYIMAGNAYRTKQWDRVDELLARNINNNSIVIQRWRRNVESLKNGQLSYHYDHWFSGILAMMSINGNI